MKKRFTEEQIIGVLREGEAGLKPTQLCRKHGISEATYYNWTKVVDAAARFSVQGSQWTPTPALIQALDEAALALRQCSGI